MCGLKSHNIKYLCLLLRVYIYTCIYIYTVYSIVGVFFTHQWAKQKFNLILNKRKRNGQFYIIYVYTNEKHIKQT